MSLSANPKYAGTGKKLGEIDFGKGEKIVIEDDGDNDSFVRLTNGNGEYVNLGDVIADMREERGDEAVIEKLKKIAVGTDSDDDDDNSSQGVSRLGPFKCDDCGKTWPGKRNQTPDGAQDICPKCHDGDN